jgi:7-cyano-7-deazaguanine synthase
LTKAVCVVSGGLDSVAAAAIAAKVKLHEMYFITFVYGQRAQREVKIAQDFGFLLNTKLHYIINISFMKSIYGDSNVITDDSRPMPEQFDPSVLVPLRNTIFLSIASAWAYSIGAPLVIFGSHTGDFRYPDCRPDFIRHLTSSFNLSELDGIRSHKREEIDIWSPAVGGLAKVDLIQQGHQLLGDSIFKTWSCRLNEEFQCGKCESCRNRRAGIADAGLTDKTEYRT